MRPDAPNVVTRLGWVGLGLDWVGLGWGWVGLGLGWVGLGLGWGWVGLHMKHKNGPIPSHKASQNFSIRPCKLNFRESIV